MKLYHNGNLLIRSMMFSDINIIFNNFKEQLWNKPKEQFENYYKDQELKKLEVIVANLDNDVAGYLILNTKPKIGPFSNENMPEISDLNVFIKYQKKGIANKLLDVTENLVSKNYDAICLGVGLHSGYGQAQKIYVKRGYIPDGSGVWYNDEKATPYSSYPVDDNLILYMYKKLKQ